MVDWKICIDSPQQRALKLCGGSLTESDGNGYGSGYGYSAAGAGGHPRVVERAGGGDGDSFDYGNCFGNGYGSGYGYSDGAGGGRGGGGGSSTKW